MRTGQRDWRGAGHQREVVTVDQHRLLALAPQEDVGRQTTYCDGVEHPLGRRMVPAALDSFACCLCARMVPGLFEPVTDFRRCGRGGERARRIDMALH